MLSSAHPSATTSDAEWQLWVDEHLGRLATFARQQTNSTTDADDILQDAIIEAWKRSDGRCPDLPLVYAYIRRRSIDLGRRKTVRSNYAAAQSGEISWLEVDYSSACDSSTLIAEVERLKPTFRDVVTLRIWGGLSFAEIGEVLDIPQNTASSRYRLALQKLSKSLTAFQK